VHHITLSANLQELKCMGRVFTTMFEFNNEQHIAMVTVGENQRKLQQYQVQLFNQEFHHLIPGGKFVFTAADHAVPASIQGQAASALFYSVRFAIEEHLRLRPTATANEEIINAVKHDSDRDS